jgi:hypothetical protein
MQVAQMWIGASADETDASCPAEKAESKDANEACRFNQLKVAQKAKREQTNVESSLQTHEPRLIGPCVTGSTLSRRRVVRQHLR